MRSTASGSHGESAGINDNHEIETASSAARPSRTERGHRHALRASPTSVRESPFDEFRLLDAGEHSQASAGARAPPPVSLL